MAEERIQLTPDGFQTLQQALEDARASIKQVTDELRESHNSGDDQNSEEATEFDVEITRERFAERVRHLEFVLSRAEVIEEDPDPERVNVGDHVIVWDFQDNKERTFEILSSEEVTQTQQGVSADSPVGLALLGRRIGDIVSVEVPDGVARYSIRRMETGA